MRGLEVKLTSISNSLPLQPHVTHTHLSGGVEAGGIIIGNDSAHIPADNVVVTGVDATRNASWPDLPPLRSEREPLFSPR